MGSKASSARRLAVTVIIDGPRAPHLKPSAVARWIERHAPRSAAGTVTVALVTDRRMRRLNRDFRSVDRPTDVLSFPAGATGVNARSSRRERAHRSGAGPARLPPVHLGDLAIAVGVAARQARAEGHDLGTEIRVLTLHGLLHLLGYDHERDRGRMQTVEERLRRRAGLPAGLIARTPRAGGER